MNWVCDFKHVKVGFRRERLEPVLRRRWGYGGHSAYENCPEAEGAIGETVPVEQVNPIKKGANPIKQSNHLDK